MFKLTILHSEAILYEGEAWSVFLQGDKGEFEILENHSPLISVLKAGNVVIDFDRALPISQGIVRMYENECTIIVDREDAKFTVNQGADAV